MKQHLSEPRPGLWYNDWKKPVAVVEGGADADADAAPSAETKKVSVMELRAHADRCTALPDEVVLMGMDGAEGGGDLMIEVRLSAVVYSPSAHVPGAGEGQGAGCVSVVQDI